MKKQTEIILRKAFRAGNRLMLFLWDAGLGPWMALWPPVTGQIMVLTHRGRKSGQLRRTPVNYAFVDGELYCIAGFGAISDWYKNLVADPAVQVWMPDGWWEGAAEEIIDAPNRLDLIRAVIIGSGFAAAFAGLDPYTVSDEALRQETKDYRVMQIHRAAPRTGLDGPGRLAWIWPLATFLLLPLIFLRRKK
mgnify:CR=1 FL=1